MWELDVLPERQGEGIGAQLLEMVAQLAHDQGRALVTEYVVADSAAGRFSASHGFQIESEPSDPLASIWRRLQHAP